MNIRAVEMLTFFNFFVDAVEISDVSFLTFDGLIDIWMVEVLHEVGAHVWIIKIFNVAVTISEVFFMGTSII